ncbi:transcriptional regulator of PTS gene [Bisgaardia hudsonensis]|uniref:Transcriptional regulator of PTS protein n=1 Tax=Bisgaardia hudsonensis TaxID=109472 RepID=A0A4R2N154_9PAST|nr:ROK family protein [Bisgaardia hudsonensis]QLB13144.1 NagC family transcriptional regulator [Bisgaardia hudsonensis]TCP13285.1 transcriptional regulator of PTS gene [Bisgaardia hudsonensis]
MPKVKQQDKLPLRMKQLGKIYRLIEQFEEISRIDLSKLSQLAPATITALTRELIDKKLVIERAVQSTEARGRPAIGLCVSPFYWQSVCAILAENHFDLSLCELDGTLIEQRSYPINLRDLSQLEPLLLDYLDQFLKDIRNELNHPITFSIAVTGELDKKTRHLRRLGDRAMDIDLKTIFSSRFDIPIIISEYFDSWLFAESSLGAVIGYKNVIFLKLDEVINLSVLLDGNILHNTINSKMNIDHFIVPHLNELQGKINCDLPENERYQLKNQITHNAIYQMIDLLYPNNEFPNHIDKINFLCEQAKNNDHRAVAILHCLADSLAYILMNFVQLFSSQKIMFSSSLLPAKEILLTRINNKLATYLEYEKTVPEVMISQYEWNSTVVITSSIKQGIYDGSLLLNLEKN